jgi:DNA invertase Pin-like site-specific DNA recombinase
VSTLHECKIAAYCRISVDEEVDRDNTSIENQKNIINEYIEKKFPNISPVFYEDRDRSGYTFEQREGYQKMRPLLMSGAYNILIVKDFSRFSRRNSRGLVELEDLRDKGVRIISIGDSIDYPSDDDWISIQFRFLVNEMPVTDTSKKVKNVIKHRQNEGKWICAVPYGYTLTNTKTMQIDVDEPSAIIVRKVFELYNQGWGYKKIANHLTDLHIPTPRAVEKARIEQRGEETKLSSKNEWSIITVQGILTNDFYIGTLRQGKYRRKKINGNDIKNDSKEHIVFENHHKPIIDYRTFAVTQEQMQNRTKTNYRGIKKYDNVYSGFLFCGDCNSPMFSMSRSDLAPAYICGTYHKRGTRGCSSHHTRVDVLDEVVKEYVGRIMTNSETMVDKLNKELKNEDKDINNTEQTADIIELELQSAKNELKATQKQKIKELIKHPRQRNNY